MSTRLASIRARITSNYDAVALSDDRQDDMVMGLSTSTSTSDPSRSTASQYSHGLNGVNIELDNQSSRALYICIGIIFIAITLLRLLQRSNAHLRQLTTYGSKSKQTYWKQDRSSVWAFIKRYIIYAPLNRIRHNKEIQLSQAVSIGTLPGRLHFVLLFIFVIMQITFMTMLDYTQTPDARMAELRGRSGHLAVMNMIALFVMAGRNNPFIRILRISFDTFNLFHRWIGRIVVVESVIHLGAWTSVKVSTSGWDALSQDLFHESFLVWGFVSTIAMVCLLLHSPSPLRHAFYETFLCLHQLLAFLALLGIFYHAKIGSLPQYGFVIIIILIWSYDRILRLTRILYINCSFAKGITRAVVEALPGNVCRVTFHTPRPFTPRAGSHIYVYLPQAGWWQSHPFSVAWTTTTDDIPIDSHDLEKGAVLSGTDTTVSLIVSARTGMTKKLHDLAVRNSNQRLVIRGMIEGPYGSLESLHSYGTVLLFAGGVGITHHLQHIRDLVKGYADKSISTQKIILIWTIQSKQSLEWVRPWMDEILCIPERRDILDIKMYVTRSKNEIHLGGSKRVQVFTGRPSVTEIVQYEFQERIGAMCVGVCGPGALADDVRCATRTIVDQGKVDLFEEAFTW